jgi:ChrR Cupin-like domain
MNQGIDLAAYFRRIGDVETLEEGTFLLKFPPSPNSTGRLLGFSRRWPMKINSDLGQRAVVYSEELPWVASPLPGVERRMLERDGAEVARATSVVRYAPDSSFDAHVHGGGEEFLVLEGVFSDEHGDFGPGMYVRNPPGSRHTPRSGPGCTILVKLRHMDPDDQEYVGSTPQRRPGSPVRSRV